MIIKAVIFDLDNTLVDFMRMKEEAVKSAVIAMIDAGLPMSYDEAFQAVMDIYQEEGIEYQEVFDHFLDRYLARIDHKILASAVVGYRRARDAALVLYPHVTTTLTTLAKWGVKLGLLTDAPPKQAWLRLCYLNLHHLFDAVVTSTEVGESKPSPRGFMMILNALGVKAHQALMVGDWPERDIQGAQSVGIRTVFARYGDRPIQGPSGADWEIDDIAQLLTIIQNINRQEGQSDR